MTCVKVCGIASETDRDAAVVAGADVLGFLVDVPVDTAREITPERAAELIAGVPPFVSTVLVTMPDSGQRALELLERTGPIPFSSTTTARPTLSRRSRGQLARVIKAAIDADPEAATRYGPATDALLVDARTGAGAGGTGRRSDWERAATICEGIDVPVVLAGGLTPDNVAEAIASVGPFAVDVSSGVERAEGRKDIDAVRAFVAAVDRRPVTP